MAIPDCPDCDTKMKKRRSRKTGNYFWGCSNYFKTKCKGFLPYRDEVEDSDKPTKKFEPSPYQKAIFDFIENGEGNAVVEAVAGSGKTTTILEALRFIPEDDDAVFCAFNKHIATELGSRAPSHVKVATIHSLGFQAINSNFKKRPTVDDKKIRSIMDEVLCDMPFEKQRVLGDSLYRIIPLVKATLADPSDIKQIGDLCDKYQIEINGEFDEVFPFVELIIDKCQEYQTVIDFDDMIYLPVALEIPMEKYDWIFVDEAQDLNACQMVMIKKMMRRNTRVICVGDRFQSIYGFRGADTMAIPNLIEELEAKQLPLSICYRCGKEIVKYAQQVVPHIEWFEDSEDGIVENLGEFKATKEMESGDMVLCRINAPLVPLAYKLIKDEKKVVIRGRDIGKGLIRLIEKLQGTSIPELMQRIGEYQERECTKLMRAKKNTEAITDKCDMILAFCEFVENIAELKAKIERIFSDDVQGIVLSSIHRAKGLESDNVFILKPELIPFPKAETKEQLQQERNLEYVCITRAKKRLVFIK